MVRLVTPRVPHLDQACGFLAFTHLEGAKNGVSVAVCDAQVTLYLIVSVSGSASLDDFVVAVVVDEQVPQIVDRDVFIIVVLTIEVEMHAVGGSGEGASRMDWVASSDVRVVAKDLRKGFLKQWAPDRAILASVCEHCPSV